MWTILKIIGILLLIGVLWGLGVIQELLTMVIIAPIIGVLLGLAFLIFGGEFGLGYHIGIYVGVALYLLYSIMRIINPEIEVTVYEGGRREERSSEFRGIVGIILVVIAFVYTAITGSW